MSTPPDLAANLDAVRARLDQAEQTHLLRFYDELSSTDQQALLTQIDALPLERLPSLIDTYVHGDGPSHAPSNIEPASFYPANPADPRRPWDRERFLRLGAETIARGKLAAFTVAGGQGSRLGYDGPKGCYPAGPVTGKPLFAFLASSILAAQDRYCPQGVTIPWYVMTSPINHDATVAFFAEHAHFGLRPDDIMFFPQGVLPSLDAETGKVLLAGKGAVAVNPDGHGGSLRALQTSGALDDMASRGVEHISYTQVDNPLARVIDPVFIGLHLAAEDSSAEMSTKIVRKAHAGEKVGVLCETDGAVRVIEYSDMPRELSDATDNTGQLRFAAGNIAIHLLGVDFVRALNADGQLALPLHRAIKKVPHVDLDSGSAVTPTEPNAVKLEAFVFDALPRAGKSLVYETERVEEFAPIKNAEGADSPATCHALQTERAARWLESAGFTVPRSADGKPGLTLELDPRDAFWPEDLAGRDALAATLTPGATLAIGAS